jgi:hypothetical protein
MYTVPLAGSLTRLTTHIQKESSSGS